MRRGQVGFECGQPRRPLMRLVEVRSKQQEAQQVQIQTPPRSRPAGNLQSRDLPIP